MPRVSAGTAGGPGWGCTCPSHLRVSQYHVALGRASEVIWEHVRNDLDGTIVFRAWSDPQNAYDVTFNPRWGGGKVCKHIMACSAHLVGPWLTGVFSEARIEREKWHELSKMNRAMERKLKRLLKK